MKVMEFAVNFLFTVRTPKSAFRIMEVDDPVKGDLTMKMDARSLGINLGVHLELHDAEFWVRNEKGEQIGSLIVENGLARIVDINPPHFGTAVLDSAIQRLAASVIPNTEDWKDLLAEVEAEVSDD